MTDPPIPHLPVDPKTILAALVTIRRRGQWSLLQVLERLEPDLTDHFLESLSEIHQTLLATGAPPKTTCRLQRRVQQLILVVLLTCRHNPSSIA